MTLLRKTNAAGKRRPISALAAILRTLRGFYGKPEPPAVTDPFEQVLLENVAYLASDERRALAFQLLKKTTGLAPEKVLAAPRATLQEIGRHGILPANTVEKLREIATICLDEFGGDLSGALRRAPAEAIKALKRFPSIGDPGAERILLFSRSLPVLALDSNGLRVLRRLGFAREDRNYTKSYRCAQEAARGQLPKDCDVLIEACQLLRRHGQELCKTNHPRCEACPLRAVCVYYGAASART